MRRFIYISAVVDVCLHAWLCWIDGGGYEDVGLERDIGEEGEITIN